MVEETQDAGDESKVKARQKAKRKRDQIEKEEIRELLKDKRFVWFLWNNVFSNCQMFTKVQGNPDPGFLAVNAGARNVGIDLWMLLEKIDPNFYRKMLDEQEERRKNQ